MESQDPRIIRTKRDVTEAALEILLTQGWDAVTHAAVAKASGYARGTIYGHWPTRLELIRDAFEQYQQMSHFATTGDTKQDLQGELKSFSNAMTDQKLDRALAMLAERAQTSTDVVKIRDSFVSAGEASIRNSLADISDPKTREVVTLMLCGMVTHSVLMHGKTPSSEDMNRAVDLTLLALETKK